MWGARFCGSCWSLNEEYEFAADAIAIGELGAYFAHSAADEFFVQLGEFACSYRAQGGAEDGFEIGEGLGYPVRCLVEDEGLRGFAGLGGY